MVEPMFSAEGITFTQWSALNSISVGHSSTCSELARDLNHDCGAIIRLIDTLENGGWLRRTADRHDRRVKRLTLTVEGERIAKACRLSMIACWNLWLADWRRDEVDQVIGLLQKLRATVEKTVVKDTA